MHYHNVFVIIKCFIVLNVIATWISAFTNCFSRLIMGRKTNCKGTRSQSEISVQINLCNHKSLMKKGTMLKFCMLIEFHEVNCSCNCLILILKDVYFTDQNIDNIYYVSFIVFNIINEMLFY